MAKDELASLGLDDDEIELIKQRRKQRREEDERTVRIKTSDGHEAELPFAAARNWLRKIGVLLEDEDPAAEEVKEPEEPEEDPKDKPVRFAGRRVS